MGQLDYGALVVPAELWRSAVGEGDDGVRAVEVHWLNGVVFTEVVFEDRLGPEIDFDLIEKHWDALYEIASRIERAVYEHFDLGPAEPSIWQTPLSLLSWDGSTSEHDALADALYTRAGRTKQPELVTVGPLIVAASWNGVVVAVHERGPGKRERVEFLFRLTCLEWAIIENVKIQIYAEMSKDGIWPRSRMLTTQNLIIACHLGLARCDPFYLAYAENDIEFVRTVERSWFLDEIKPMARQLLDDMSKMYAAQFERYQLEASIAQENRQRLLNLIVAWVGIAGVAGTVAGVLSFIDYQNEHFGAMFRIVSLILSTGLFMAWVLWKLTAAGPPRDDD